MNKLQQVIFFFLTALAVSCTRDTNGEKSEPPSLFEPVEVSASRLDFENNLIETDTLNILDYLYFYNGGGVAIGDINNDGLQDIFFTSNQGSNQLYLNKGDFEFENITSTAGVAGTADWNTGVTMADINADGFLDIYVMAVSGILGLKGKNELFINNGDGTFNERAAAFGIDLENYGTTAAFFDYDNDGFLDLYVLNHAVHTEDSFGPAAVRSRRSDFSGDKLFKFDGEKFQDVSEEAGIFGGPNGYGLGLATADFNNDGYVDIYVSNDFHEDDYLYINNRDGTFSEKMQEQMQQVSRFSMGNDVADINHDGFPDLVTLDMLPQDEKVLKSSMGDEDITVLELRQKFGYHRQFSRNMLQLNNNGKGFQEIGLLSGIGATDWSWAPLFADYNKDGETDLFITNGIIKRPNDLDYIKYLSNSEIRKNQSTATIDRKALELMPEGKVANYLYMGTGGLSFRDRSAEMLGSEKTFSNGSAYADLDNDGDLDLVVNNLNAPASLYRNISDASNGYLKLRFSMPEGANSRGIGTKVYSWHKGALQYMQLFTSKGFQSSSEDAIFLGYGETPKIDSLIIIWPDQKVRKLFDLDVNQSLTLTPGDGMAGEMFSLEYDEPKFFEKVDSLAGLHYRHRENPYNDFNRQKLIPYRISDAGPAVAIGDLDGNGEEDILIGSSRGYVSEVFLQENDRFVSAELPFLEEMRKLEITGLTIADFTGNGFNDVFYVTGGGEFSGRSSALEDGLWSYDGKEWKKIKLPEYYSSASILRTADYDNDGDLDVFIGGRAVAGDFGRIPRSFLLENKNGLFKIVANPDLENAGMITDAVWQDSNGDNYPELILVGEWMAPKIFRNTGGQLREETPAVIKELSGLWQSITSFDVDEDGQQDLLLGNWGLNSKFKASAEFPLRMYYGDIDQNGSTETIVAQESDGAYYPIVGLDELVSQMNFLRKDFPTYKEFAGKNVEEIFGKNRLAGLAKMELTTLESGYLKREKDDFVFVPFEEKMQLAPIKTISVSDHRDSSKRIAVLGGNYFGITPFQGAMGAFPGAVIQEGEVLTGENTGLDFTGKAVKAFEFVQIGGKKFLLVFSNEDAVEVYKLNRNDIF